MKRILLGAAGVVALAAAPVVAGEWKYDYVLYGWLTGLEGTIGVVDLAEEPVDATFDDLLGYVDFAMAGHFEAKGTTALLVMDVAYFNLGSERDATIANQPVTVDLDLQQWIIEAGGGYPATPELDLLLVGRYYILDMGAVSSSVAGESTTGTTENWGDVYLGARYTRLIKEKWRFSIRGDVGAGGSEFAWFGDLVLGYRFTPLVSAGVAWRVLSVDREGDLASADYFLYDITQNGLGIGVGFSF
jgi:hypothetical protein